MTRLFLVIFLVIGAVGLQAQIEPPRQKIDRDYEVFKQQFDAEFQDKNTIKPEVEKQPGRRGFYAPFELPAWLFEVWDHAPGRTLAIGISDPGMDSIQGHRQALIRALGMVALSEKCRIENVLDNYYLDKEQRKTLGKFNSFTNLFAIKSFSYKSISIIQQEMTSFGETILLIALTQDLTTKLPDGEVKLLIENFESEQTQTKKPFIIGKVRSILQYPDSAGQLQTYTWQKNIAPNVGEIESGTDSLVPFDFEKSFTYRAPQVSPELKPTNDFSQYFTLEQGLWDAWQSAVINHLEQMDVFNSQVKNLDEQLGDQFQGLIRVIFSGEGSFRISLAIVEENQLLLEFE